MFVYSGLVWVQYTACREGICRAAICVRCTFVLHHSIVLRYRQSHRLHSESRCVATTIEVRRAEYSQHNDSMDISGQFEQRRQVVSFRIFFFKAHFRKKSNVTKSDRHKSIKKPQTNQESGPEGSRNSYSQSGETPAGCKRSRSVTWRFQTP